MRHSLFTTIALLLIDDGHFHVPRSPAKVVTRGVDGHVGVLSLILRSYAHEVWNHFFSALRIQKTYKKTIRCIETRGIRLRAPISVPRGVLLSRRMRMSSCPTDSRSLAVFAQYDVLHNAQHQRDRVHDVQEPRERRRGVRPFQFLNL